MKFEAQKYRDNLAEEIKSQPNKENREKTLEKAKETKAYQEAREIHLENISNKDVAKDFSDKDIAIEEILTKGDDRRATYENTVRFLDEMGSNDEYMLHLCDVVKSNKLDIPLYWIAIHSKNISTKIEIIRRLKVAAESGDPESKKAFGTVSSIRENIAENLVLNGDYNKMLQLIDEGYLDEVDYSVVLHGIHSEQFLNELISRATWFGDSYHKRNLLKFITDKEFLARIEDVGESYFSRANEDFARPEMIKEVKRLRQALEKPLECFQAGDLREYNRFVVGRLDNEKENRIVFGWGNINQYHGHANIVDEIKKHFNMFSLADNFTTGGYLRFFSDGDRIIAIFSGSSGDFGTYSHLVLQKFKDDILQTLKEKFIDKDIELKIEVSGGSTPWYYEQKA